ncbi:MAG TPA: hypothetical protein VGK14_09250 [Novimethylophilus sp.]
MQQSQKMQNGRLVWVGIKNSAVMRFRLGNPSCLMMLQSKLD